MLKDVGIEVLKRIDQNAACMQAKAGGMVACNNHNMHNPLYLHMLGYGVTHFCTLSSHAFACMHAAL